MQSLVGKLDWKTKHTSERFQLSPVFPGGHGKIDATKTEGKKEKQLTAVATLNASSVGVGIVDVVGGGGVAMSFAATRENSVVGVVREFYIYERVYGRAISKAVRGGSMKHRFLNEIKISNFNGVKITTAK